MKNNGIPPIVGALINGNYEKLNYVLQNKDRVELLVDDLHFRIEDEERICEKIRLSQEQSYQECKVKRFHT